MCSRSAYICLWEYSQSAYICLWEYSLNAIKVLLLTDCSKYFSDNKCVVKMMMMIADMPGGLYSSVFKCVISFNIWGCVENLF